MKVELNYSTDGSPTSLYPINNALLAAESRFGVRYRWEEQGKNARFVLEGNTDNVTKARNYFSERIGQPTKEGVTD